MDYREKKISYQKEYYLKNREYRINYQKDYHKKNLSENEEYKKLKSQYDRRYYNENIVGRKKYFQEQRHKRKRPKDVSGVELNNLLEIV